MRADLEVWAGCVAGILKKEDYQSVFEALEFSHVAAMKEATYDFLHGPAQCDAARGELQLATAGRPDTGPRH